MTNRVTGSGEARSGLAGTKRMLLWSWSACKCRTEWAPSIGPACSVPELIESLISTKPYLYKQAPIADLLRRIPGGAGAGMRWQS